MLAEEGGVPVVFCGQARRHGDDVALLRELADAREDCVSDPTTEGVVVVASVGEQSLHGVDQEVVVHQSTRREDLSAGRSSWSRLRMVCFPVPGKPLRTTIMPPGARWIGLFLRMGCNR